MAEERDTIRLGEKFLVIAAGAFIVVLVSTFTVWCVRADLEQRRDRREARLERRRQMQEVAVDLAREVASSRGAVARVVCKERESNVDATWSLQECSVVFADERWASVVCDVGHVPGCRIDWIGRDGGPRRSEEPKRKPR